MANVTVMNSGCKHSRTLNVFAVLALPIALAAALLLPAAAWADEPVATGAGDEPISTAAEPTVEALDWYPRNTSAFKEFHNLGTEARVVDNADILSPEAEAALAQRIEAMRSNLGLDFVFVSEPNDYGLSHQQYAADFYTFNGYGVGESYDGVIYYVCMDPNNRGFFTAACGNAQEYMTESNVEAMDDATIDLFREGDYDAAVALQFENLDYLYSNGKLPFDWSGVGMGILAGLGFGIFYGKREQAEKRRKMETVVPANRANKYATGKPVFCKKTDQVTGHNITRTPIVPVSSDSDDFSSSSFSGGFSSSGGSGGGHSFSGGGRSF